MSCSIRKIIKCVIAFSFIFTVVGCRVSKERTNKEIAEQLKCSLTEVDIIIELNNN